MLQMLALVFVDALDLDVEHRVGIDDDPGACSRQRGEFALVGLLDLRASGRETGVVGSGSSARSCDRSLIQPSPIAR
jgi:hypothetical protein